MRSKTCCFSGHRELPTGLSRWRPAKRLEKTVIEQIENGVRFFGAGGALGFDTLAAQTVLKLREKYPAIKLILVLPCQTQAQNWSAENVEEYERIKAQADKVVYTSQVYTKSCMHKRNRHLVDNSSVCICYLTGDTGGTAYTVGYARSKGLRIFNLAQPKGGNTLPFFTSHQCR